MAVHPGSCVRYLSEDATRSFHLLSFKHKKKRKHIQVTCSLDTANYCFASAWPACVVKGRHSIANAFCSNHRLIYFHRRNHTVPGLGFRLTSPEALEEAVFECGRESNPPRLTAGVEIKANYTEGCYNIDEIFSWRPENQTGRFDRSCHWDSASCPNEWRYLEQSNFNPNATNSIITTILAGDRMSEWLDGPAQVFRTFEYEDCDGEGDWHQWTGCEDERDECRELPYGVKSFHVSYQDEDTRTDGCVLAGERGASESAAGVLGVNGIASLAVAAIVMAYSSGL